MYATGPLAGVMLSDLGADVIKIEDAAAGGDLTRSMRIINSVIDCEIAPNRNAWFEIMNWNKRSVTLNLKHPQGREIALQLIEKADVFLLNFRPPVAERLGLDYETVAQRNPRIIYASASAYGESGPQADRAGNDYTGQARSGMMWGVGKDGDPPMHHTAAPADKAGATLLSHAVITALLARERYGVGQKVELSNLGAAMWLQYYALGLVLLTGQQWPRVDRRSPGNVLTNSYRCQDGRWLVMASLRRENWPSFCHLVGLEQLLDDERFASPESRRQNTVELTRILDAHFLTRPREEWERMLAHDPSLAFERIQHLHELGEDPQILENGYITEMDHPIYGRVKVQDYPIRFSETHTKKRRPAPELGEHNFSILVDELGYSPEQIGELISNGALG